MDCQIAVEGYRAAVWGDEMVDKVFGKISLRLVMVYMLGDAAGGMTDISKSAVEADPDPQPSANKVMDEALWEAEEGSGGVGSEHSA